MNLLVICADTFRADYLGCYGSTWVRTPCLDRLAAEGIRFTDFYAEGLPTLPARRVFYTGRRVFPFAYHPQKSDLVQLPGWHPLFDEDITLAEWLRERGYMTGLISDLYHMMKPGKNFHRGFHSWEWIRGQECDPLVPTVRGDIDLSRYISRDLPEDSPFRLMFAQYLNNRSWWRGEADHYAAQVMRCAADWLTRYGHQKPWMLWVESFDPHEPWDPPAEYVSAYSPDYEGIDPIWPSAFSTDYTPDEFGRIRALYAGECTHVDKWCGHLIDTLDSLGLKDDTLVAFTSDHGMILGEQGELHKGQDRLRVQVSRCPLLLRHPDRSLAGKTVEGFVQHHDLMPTLLRLLGEPVPERCNGGDFWPLVAGAQSGGLRDTVITAFGAYASVRTKEWNYQAAWDRTQSRIRPPELYHRDSDPEELVNVFDDHPDVACELQARLDEVFRNRPQAAGMAGETETPAAVPGVKW